MISMRTQRGLWPQQKEELRERGHAQGKPHPFECPSAPSAQRCRGVRDEGARQDRRQVLGVSPSVNFHSPDLFGSQIQGDLRVDAGSGVSLHVRLSWKGRWRPAFSLSRIFVPVPSGRGASQGHPPAV